MITWTAPGDDGASGRATTYDLRYSETPVGSDTTGWWAAATPAGFLPAPLAAGSRETYTLSGLPPGTTYYLMIRTADEVPNWSTLSNVSIRQTVPPIVDSLTTPTGLTATPVPGGARLLWDPIPSGSALGLHLYRGAPGGPAPPLLATLGVSDTAWIDSTVSGGATYEYRLAAFNGSGEGNAAITTLAMPGDRLLVQTSLHGYPNPARGPVTFRFHVNAGDRRTRTRVTVFDLTGRKVRGLLDEVVAEGEHALVWNGHSERGTPVAPGLYTVILDGPSGRDVTHLALLP